MFELALCGVISSFEVLEWFVKDLPLVFVNSFVPGMATVLLHYQHAQSRWYTIYAAHRHAGCGLWIMINVWQ